MLGRGINPARFANLLNDFRHNITRERMAARLKEVTQDEVIGLVKMQAEIKARYLLAMLDLLQPNLRDIEGKMSEVKMYREMVEEMDRGVKAMIDAIIGREVPMPGLDHGPEFTEDIDHVIAEFMKSKPYDEM